MRIHNHDHEINQGRSILELNQHILCYLIGLHYNGVCQSQLMRGRDQWVLVQAVIDHLCHTRFLCHNQVLIVCMTQDQLFHTYGQK
jgi:hypothetical protein